MTNKFRFMLLSMAALGIVSCSDKLTDDGTLVDTSQNGIEDGFVSFKISNIGSGMRAAGSNDNSGNYEAGTEHAITTDQGANVVFFFAENGNYYGKSYLQLMTGTENDQTNNDGHSNEKIYSARVKKSNGNTGFVPASCILILNADPTQLETLTDISLSELGEVCANGLGQYKSGETTFFTMSNTVYVNEKDETATDYLKVESAVKVDPSKHICSTWTAAQENPIEVHVERVAAKFEVTFTDNDKNILTNGIKTFPDEKDQLPLRKLENNVVVDGSTTQWAVRINSWDVNATEKETYYLKNLQFGNNIEGGTLTTPDFGFWGLTYNAAAAVNSFGWNDYNNLRSYWAVDPHYATGANKNNAVYPEQYREAKDITGGVEDYNKNTANHALDYISYSQIGKNIGTGTYQYAPENTFGFYDGIMTKTDETNEAGKTTYEFQDYGYKRTATHILIAAQLLFDGEVEGGDVADKYCFEGVYWTAEAAEKELVEYMVNSLMNYFSTTIYTDKDGLSTITATELAKYFTLVKATIKGGDGRVMLSFNNTENIHLYKYNGTTENNEKTYVEITSSDLEKAIYEIGTAKCFKEGKMYYAIPIEHMVKTDDIDNDDETTTHKWNVGSYGVVRNHWYKVNVSNITTPGTSVEDPDQPIIPNDDPDEGVYIAFNIVIIPWHVLNQDVSF